MTGHPERFTPPARAAILETTLGRCAGCNRPTTPTAPLECQHRRARMMGGTHNPRLGHPDNGVPLCRYCHEWAEHHPAYALTLGWMLYPNDDPLAVPFYTRTGWRQWVIADDQPHGEPPAPQDWLVQYVDVDRATAATRAGTTPTDPMTHAATTALHTARPTQETKR